MGYIYIILMKVMMSKAAFNYTFSLFTLKVNGESIGIKSVYMSMKCKLYELWHEISNNVVCTTSKASDQPAYTRSLIRAFASSLNI